MTVLSMRLCPPYNFSFMDDLGRKATKILPRIESYEVIRSGIPSEYIHPLPPLNHRAKSKSREAIAAADFFGDLENTPDDEFWLWITPLPLVGDLGRISEKSGMTDYERVGKRRDFEPRAILTTYPVHSLFPDINKRRNLDVRCGLHLVTHGEYNLENHEPAQDHSLPNCLMSSFQLQVKYNKNFGGYCPPCKRKIEDRS